jgi:putative colanic acid biosynthesis acetyltransferase WcaF
LSIDEYSSIGDGAWVYALDKITIGRNVCIGEDVRLITGSHDITTPSFDLITKPITIKNNVWVATAAMILPGVTIGEGAVIAAGAVGTKDVEQWTVVGGNPARFIKKRVLNDD